jgi:hypothetical protein
MSIIASSSISLYLCFLVIHTYLTFRRVIGTTKQSEIVEKELNQMLNIVPTNQVHVMS